MGQTLADVVAHVPGLERLRTKATVLGGTTANLGELAGDVAAREYLNLMAKRTVLGRLTGTLTAPPHVQIPTPATDPTPYWIQEGAPMPLPLMSFTDPRTSISKFGVVMAFTRELFRVADDRAVSLIERVTLRALVRAEDMLLLSATAASGNIPAGRPNGLSAIGGGSPESIADLEPLVSAVSDGDTDRLYFVGSPRGMMHLAGLHTDGVPRFPVDHVERRRPRGVQGRCELPSVRAA